MSPLQAAKEHCANWNCGACLGMNYSDDLSVDWSRHSPRPKCLLAEGRRCRYFEEIIIPMHMSRETARAETRATIKMAQLRDIWSSMASSLSRVRLRNACAEIVVGRKWQAGSASVTSVHRGETNHHIVLASAAVGRLG
jgi:hypothetical protein